MKIPNLKTGALILIIWDDAFAPMDHYWATANDIAEIREVHTVGHFIKKSKRFVHVAQSYGNGRKDELDGIGGAFAVPVGCVKSIHKLSKGKS